MRRRAALAATFGAVMIVAACAPRTDAANGADTTPRTDSTPGPSPRSASGGEAPIVIGSCCPDSDSAIYALMERYERTPEADRTPEISIWAYRMSSGFREAERLIVRDSASWAQVWPRIVGSHSPKPRPPAVNFGNEMLLVVSMGTRSSGGYIIAIDSVAVRGDTLRVLVREQSPGPRCGTTAALSAPVALARIRRTDLPVSFTTRTVVKDCA